MTQYEVLNQLEQKKIHLKKAYQMLYKKQKERKPRRAHFVKMSISIPEEKGVNAFLKILLFLPIPLWIVKLVLKKRGNQKLSDEIPITFKEMLDLMMIRGSRVDVKTQDQVKVLIKTI
ncbi:MAG: hypothetical protein V3569_03450 [Acholeplasmataceae bacterium]|nr:hypothetical protein [Acholeplasmataceae bacterium]